MMGDFFPSAKDRKVKPDVCSTCTCHNETSICIKKTCPVLECSPEHQLNRIGECCPSCPPLVTELVSSTCTYKGVTYQVSKMQQIISNSFENNNCFNFEIIEQRNMESRAMSVMWMSCWWNTLCSNPVSKDKMSTERESHCARGSMLS